jgi:DNA-binding MarR family transcriptional regulator
MFIVDPLLSRATMNRHESVPRPPFTPRQGQYLAFIHAYTLVNGRPPAHADIQRFFRLTPPTVHQMLLTLEKAGLISRQPGRPRSVGFQPVKITVTRY